MAGELTLARSGALDTDLLAQQPFYGTNFTNHCCSSKTAPTSSTMPPRWA
jgi:hypothetical protein